jgi:hypothetical protein
MVHGRDREGFHDRAFNIPDNGIPPNCDDGGIWTNLTEKELVICLGGQHRHIPHSGYDRCRLTKSADQPLPTTGFEDITFDQETYDEGDIHDTITNNERVNIAENGDYMIFQSVEMNPVGNIDYSSRVMINDVTEILRVDKCRVGPSACNMFLVNGDIFPLSSGDYLKLQARHAIGTGISVIKDHTFFTVAKLHGV